MATPLVNPFLRFFTITGTLAGLSSGKLIFSEAGGSTPKAVYGDASESVSLGAEVTFDVTGMTQVFLGDGNYKVVLKDSLGNVIDTADNVKGLSSTDALIASRVTIEAASPLMIIKDTDNTSGDLLTSYLLFRDSLDAQTGVLGFSSTANSHFYVRNSIVGGDILFYAEDVLRATIDGPTGVFTSHYGVTIAANKNLTMSAGADILLSSTTDITGTAFSVDGATGATTAGTLNIGSTIVLTGTLNEDDMVSNSAVSVVTQRSIKNYVEGKLQTADGIISIVEGVGSPNIIMGYNGNTIASGTTSRANTISGGGFLSAINQIDGDETRYATIAGGYDNYIDGVSSTETLDGASSTISGGAHNLIQSTHATICGGSFNEINVEAEYSVIAAGTLNIIEDNCAYAAILGGDQNTLKNGGTTDTSGFRAVIVGGISNTIWGRNSGIIAGSTNTIYKGAHYSYILGNNNTLGDTAGTSGVGVNSFAIGDGNILNSSAGSQCGAMGLSNTVDGTNAYAFGRNHTISSYNYCSAFGTGAIVPHTAAHVHTGRNSSIGNGANQALEYNMSQETTGAVLVRLSLSGSSTWPTMPENSVVDGTINVSGVDVATGDTYSSVVEFTVKRIGTANPTIVSQANTTKGTEITPAAAPTVEVTTSGRYRLAVTGEAAKTVNWNAVVRAHQTVYA